MTLRTRLLLAQAPLAAGLALVGLFALNTVQTLGRGSERILQDNFRSVLAAQRMNEAAERIDGAALFRIAGRPEKADAQAALNLEAFVTELRIQSGNITESGEAEATRALRGAWDEYRARYLELSSVGEERDLRRRYFQDCSPLSSV